MFNTVERVDDRVDVRRVIISVYDKTGLDDFVRSLLDISPDIIIYSTGGTHDCIRALLETGTCARGAATAAKNLVAIPAYTGQPEMQGGLVKSLDFKIYLGLLSEPYNPAHEADLTRAGAVNFDMVVANLYPFKTARAKTGATAEEIRANIDIGGPCMLRAAAKNYLRVAAVSDPADYAEVLAELRSSAAFARSRQRAGTAAAGATGTGPAAGSLSFATRVGLARKTFARIAAYDAAISSYFAGMVDDFFSDPYRFQGE